MGAHGGAFAFETSRCAPGDGLPGREHAFCSRIVGAARSPNPLRILALGDSLTEGFVFTAGGAPAFWPYAFQLAFEFPSHAFVVEAGISGECTDFMAQRLEHLLASGGAFDVAVILGGTNDIYYKRPIPAAIANLRRMHAAAHAAGIKTIALAVPNADPSLAHGAISAEINDALGKFCVLPACRVVRLDEMFPFSADVFSDMVHFSKTGYEAVGIAIADAIRSSGWDKRS
eukprot:c45974_g1_i1.p2 GENE.c45974_g1_i1~~c45974_g1_i1.p2  ORF type:complete len:230 (+),score=40.87 c45974_g1_i1:2-691(+)